MTENLKTAGAVLLGLVLASMPFTMFGVGGGHSHRAGPHMDHAARHGGQLGMVGDYHVELVRDDGRILVYASDALRRPVTATRGVLVFNETAPISMRREPFKLSALDRPIAQDVTCTLWLEDGTRLELTFGLDTTIAAS